jgi:hypothetical protein
MRFIKGIVLLGALMGTSAANAGQSGYYVIDNTWGETGYAYSEAQCQYTTQVIISGGCWGSSGMTLNQHWPQPNGTGNYDFYHCEASMPSGSYLYARVVCH